MIFIWLKAIDLDEKGAYLNILVFGGIHLEIFD